jgi:hypothetical protein
MRLALYQLCACKSLLAYIYAIGSADTPMPNTPYDINVCSLYAFIVSDIF